MLTRALSWSLLASVLGIGVQIALLPILARLLGPAEFGLIASAALAMRFVSYFAQLGLGPALIQRSALEPGHHAAAFAAALGMGLASWLIFVALAYPFAAFFREPALHDILLLAPAGMLFASLASVPQSLLRRHLRFKALAGVDLFALVLGYGVTGVALAATGHGVWSLVIASIAQQVLTLAGASFFARANPFARVERRHFRDLFAYGARHSIIGFLDFISANVETLFIGRVLGTEKLGIYNRGQTLVTMPVEQIMGAASRVMFPAFSTMRQSAGKLREGVLLSIHLSSLITLPLAVGMAVAADNLVLTVLGAKWAAAVDVAMIAALCVPSAYISLFAGSALDSLAQFRGKGLLIVGITALKLGLMWGLSRYGLAGIAISLVIAEWSRALWMMALLRRHLQVTMRDFLVRLKHGAAVAACVAATVLLAGVSSVHLFPAAPPWVPLLAQVLCGSIVFAAAAWSCLRGVIGFYPGHLLDLGFLRRLARI